MYMYNTNNNNDNNNDNHDNKNDNNHKHNTNDKYTVRITKNWISPGGCRGEGPPTFLVGERRSAPKGGRQSTKTLPAKCPSVQWQPDGLTIHTKKRGSKELDS